MRAVFQMSCDAQQVVVLRWRDAFSSPLRATEFEHLPRDAHHLSFLRHHQCHPHSIATKISQDYGGH